MTVDMIKALKDLAQTLMEIANIDSRPEELKDYERRYPLVYRALSLALDCGFEAGVRLDSSSGASYSWPVVYIELPTGQVSWHQPEHPKPWDKHTNGEKHLRIWRWIDSLGARAVHSEPGVTNRIEGHVTGTTIQAHTISGPVNL